MSRRPPAKRPAARSAIRNLEGSMPDRRSVLALMAALGLLPLAAGPAAALAPAPALPEVRRYGRHFIVNGWILTARDLETLGLHAG
jgi:hypothetical protein